MSDFVSVAAVVDAATDLSRLAALERTHRDNVYLDLDIEEVDAMGLGIDHLVMSPNYGVFVALDRFGGPASVLLGGHAWCRIRHADLPSFRASWEVLRDTADLVAQVAPHIESYGNGEDDVHEAIRVLDEAVQVAEGSGMDLVLLCCRS